MSAQLLRHHNGMWMRAGRYAHSDAEAIVSVRDHDGYLLRGFAGEPITAILDVGAYIGSFSALAAEVFPTATIAAVEPNAACWECLVRNVPERVRVFRGALAYDDQRQFHADDIHPMSSCLVDGDGVSVPKFTIEQIATECGVPQFDFIKLDCEGAEYSILPHAVQDAAVIVGEAHFEPPYSRGQWERLVADVIGTEWTRTTWDPQPATELFRFERSRS